MCVMRESVVEVDDHRLGVPWAAATAADGRKVVFVRRSDIGILDRYCLMGPLLCPIFTALFSSAA